MKSKLPAQILEFFREQGRRGGKLSSAARMEKMTPEQRSAVASNAGKKGVAAREAKRRKRRYELELPPPSVLKARLERLSATDAYLVRSVAQEGKPPSELARVWGKPETEILQRVREAIRKLSSHD